MTFAFWGLFVVLGLTVVGYYSWMVWAERREAAEPRATDRSEPS